MYWLELIFRLFRVEKLIEWFHSSNDRKKQLAERQAYLESRAEELRTWGKSDD